MLWNKDHTTGEIDDTVISNNGDRSEKVLATVVATVYALLTSIQTLRFMQHAHKSKNTVYRMGITKYFWKRQRTLKFWVNELTTGKLSKMLNTMDFSLKEKIKNLQLYKNLYLCAMKIIKEIKNGKFRLYGLTSH